MASAHDVAKDILERQSPMTTWKLQKLVYYSQAWHIVWEDEALFDERIEAWANGPVVRTLYDLHKGKFEVARWPQGKIRNLSPKQRESIDAVLDFYGNKTGHWLSELTHMEDPWRKARVGLSMNERGRKQITRGSMSDYYSNLATAASV
jgi:uncharacterized phage-associated protein